MGSSKRATTGFTIVELLIVIVIIAILAAIVIVAYNGITNRTKASASLTSAQEVAKKAVVHSLSNGETLPATLADMSITNSDNATYQYTVNTAVSPNTFCVTVTMSGVSAHAAGTTTVVRDAVAGHCPGHTGSSPTTLADGSSCPAGYIVVPGSSLYNTSAFCVMKYEAKDNGSGVAVSQASGTPWATITQTAASTAAAASCAGCHLITEAEWLTIAQNVMSVNENWSGGAVGSGYLYRGHTDSSPNNSLAATTDDTDGYNGTGNTTGEQRRTLVLSNGEVIWDFAGNVWELTQGTTSNGNQPGSPGSSWRNWNALAAYGSLSPDPHPAYANPAAASWTSSQNIGQIYSDSASLTAQTIPRGGGWSHGSSSGIFAMRLYGPLSATANIIGFRAAR